MSDIINSTSQPMPDSFQEQNLIVQKETKQSPLTNPIISEGLKKIKQHANHMPQQSRYALRIF